MPFGKVHEFDLHGRGNWDAYVRLVEQYILLNEIKEKFRVATLVTHVGSATYELMCDLCAPDHPETKDYKTLVELVKNHLDPKRSEIAERHIFRQRRQAEGESVGVFLQNLKHLATYCNFDSKLEENIRDQFVSGLRSEDMRSRFFAEPTLDYKKAVELALALEAAERHAETAARGGGDGGAPAAGLGPALAHYEPSLPLVLCVDSSAYGLGAVLAQRYPDGTERLVCCASRTLSETERRYSQIDKEALAIVYGVNKHHQYLFGRKFTLRSDHKALTYIFGPKHGIPQTAASRLQRYAVRLAAYDFTIEFVSTDKNGNADGLSRLPLPAGSRNNNEDDAAYLHFVEETFPLSHRDVARETKKDITLCKVYGYIMSGWPSDTEIENEKPYFHRKDTLHIDHDCIVWGYRVVIPRSLRAQVVEEVHAGHVGMVRMKQIARSYVWWPGLDADLERRARSCDACRAELDAPPRAAPATYAWPAEPWVRLHADFLHHNGRTYFLLIDAHSKWIEVFSMTSGTTAAHVTIKLREVFARYGLPIQLVTDGGPPFTSHDFELFLQKNGVFHVVTAPYHPSSNGAAENAVKTVKKVLKKATTEGENVETALLKFLLQYRNSQHSSTAREPAVAMLGRRLRTRLDLLRAGSAAPAARVQAAQSAQLRHAGGTTRELRQGDQVLVRNYSKNGPKWREGLVTERTGAVTYNVKVGEQDGSKHIDQLIKRKVVRYSLSSDNLSSEPDIPLPSPSQQDEILSRPEPPEFQDAEASLEEDESNRALLPPPGTPAREPVASTEQARTRRPRAKINYKI
ncbi:uncharacterized protein K02A2.6-like [Cydia strobilella]|uniref:uncharacterized protein K02A2.6-like n=1 Tax=Cydia strobilella TaxID=1100964 RepID=UPI0030074D09